MRKIIRKLVIKNWGDIAHLILGFITSLALMFGYLLHGILLIVGFVTYQVIDFFKGEPLNETLEDLQEFITGFVVGVVISLVIDFIL